MNYGQQCVLTGNNSCLIPMSNSTSALDQSLELFSIHKFSSNHWIKLTVYLLETNLG